MRAIQPVVRTLLSAMTLSGALLSVAGVAAQASAQGSNLVDLANRKTLEVTLRLADSSSARADGAHVLEVAGGRVDRNALVHSVTLNWIDANGETVDGRAPGYVRVIRVSSAMANSGSRALLVVPTMTSEYHLPRPLGVRVDVQDSLEFQGLVQVEPTATARYLRVHIEYETFDSPVSRMIVVPTVLDNAMTVNGTTSEAKAPVSTLEWTWTADATGRLLAIAGETLQRASRLSIEDASTGEVLWTIPIESEASAAGARGLDCVRMGVPVVAGHAYRLRIQANTRQLSTVASMNAPVMAMVLARSYASR